MTDTEDQRTARAAAAGEEEIALFVHDPSPAVIAVLLGNRNLTEEHLLLIAGRKNLPPDILESIARNKRWAESYPVRLALAKNPKTPLFTALSIARFLRLFDLAELARNHALPVIYRRKLEAIVIEKIPTLALGVKKTLAKIAAGEILISLILDGYPEVVKACLENPHLVEAGLYKIISRRITTGGIIRTIADSKTWTCRYHIKFALIRNEHTPLVRSVQFIHDLKLGDLRELYRDPSLPQTVRPYIHQELMERGIDPEFLRPSDEENILEIPQGDIEDAERIVQEYADQAKEERHAVSSDREERTDGSDAEANTEEQP